MSREGPPQTKLVKIERQSHVTIASDGLTANNNGRQFESVKANTKVKSGKWYYEVKLQTNGLMQIGWCTPSFSPNASEGNGVGDDDKSWAYDGSRSLKWHSGSTYYGQYWYTGDVIGCAVDFDEKKMSFYKNGSNLGVAFDNFNAGEGLFPAMTLSQSQKVVVNFGSTNFTYPLEGHKGLHCFLSEQDMQNLGTLFNKYKGVGISLSESGETGDVMKGQGMMQYAADLGITEDTDPGLLILAFKLGAEEQWEFSREEFVGGWTGYSAASLDKMKSKLAEWRSELQNTEEFKKFYYWLFDYLKEEKKTILLLEEATTIWDILDMKSKWPKFWDQWTKFLNEKSTKSISKDTWRQFYDFTLTHPTSLEGYDEMGSWPILIDEFHEWATGKQDGHSDF
ncbi:Ryanodine receptor 44F [Balamuthia mandrillaris]